MIENNVVTIRCPHCGERTPHVYEDGDSYEYEDNTFRFACPKCGKLHKVLIVARISYETSVFRELRCVNGDAPHDYDDIGYCKECFEESDELKQKHEKWDSDQKKLIMPASCVTINAIYNPPSLLDGDGVMVIQAKPGGIK